MVVVYNQKRHTLGDLNMDKSVLLAIEDHLKAALLLSEKEDIALLVYMISVALMDVRDRIEGKIKPK